MPLGRCNDSTDLELFFEMHFLNQSESMCSIARIHPISHCSMWFAKEAKWQILHHTSNFYLIWHLSTYYFLVVKSLINESHFDQCQRGKPELLWWWSRYGTVINWRLLGLKDLLIFLITILSTKWCQDRKKIWKRIVIGLAL